MATVSPVSELRVEGYSFPPAVKPPGSSQSLFLAAAGVRGLEIQGKFIKFTAIGVYLETDAIPHLALKWKGKSAAELANSDQFYSDVIKCPFEKFTRITTILPLTGEQYSEKVAENSVAGLKVAGIFGEEEAAAVDKFKEVFKGLNFPPSSSILFTYSTSGSLTIGISNDGSSPEDGITVIDNKGLAETILESIIGKHGVSPEATKCLAERISQLLSNHSIPTPKLPVDQNNIIPV
ncbi:chalcone--flavonone isomerase isoform X1 [Amborella trichopoda]|uniref:Chalcone-flavonone isomerase family protein n=1 Tax=Amborella trichopoda TaxID=13333 RepID=W1PWU2_AMBTC|nr:chalcone--flavonone isomerase isoform X1 [Amborella trichopoda]ERN12266.1 hypothetical protein AMTR_s00034p00233920 [Amborella trichopoda]|eukprot:XP_006850685.1 chalcone--flavonone isomerase isoform X1 [Amborella trichopoda]